MRVEEEDGAVVAAIRAAVPDVIAVYRFGSSVRSVRPPESDVDLAVLAEHPLESRNRFDLQESLASAIGCDVDLVDLRRASTVMAMQVITTARVLYAADDHARGAFEDLTFGLYARFNEERRGILERVAEEGTVYGR